jgi:predicted branched-subunit amino acid permease
MFFFSKIRRHPEFRAGMRASMGVAPGIAIWGVMTGVAMIKSGMSLVEVVTMTMIVYAGSSQLAATPLIVAGAPAWVIWATAACVNLRFVVFSLHLREYLMHLPRWRRLLNGFMTADMTYALFTNRHPEPATDPQDQLAQEAYLAGNYFVTWVGWTGGCLLGTAVGHMIPPAWGVGFAGVLCLLGIVCSLANTPMRVLAALVSGVTAVAAYALPLKLNVVLAIVVTVLACLWVESHLPGRLRERAA